MNLLMAASEECADHGVDSWPQAASIIALFVCIAVVAVAGIRGWLDEEND